jgi:hypothetical protein
MYCVFAERRGVSTSQLQPPAERHPQGVHRQRHLHLPVVPDAVGDIFCSSPKICRSRMCSARALSHARSRCDTRARLGFCIANLIEYV